MIEKKRGFIFETIQGWTYKDFVLGATIRSESWNEFREYYILLSLGFWQVAIGFRI